MAGLAESIVDKGSLRAIFDDNNGNNPTPIVQCLQIKAMTGKDQQDRFRIIFSDTENFIQSMLATTINDVVTEGLLKKGSICKLMEYQPSLVKDKQILIVMKIEILAEYGEHDKLGNPTSLETGVGQAQGNGRPQGQAAAGVPANNFYGKPAVKSEQTTQRALPSRPNNGTDGTHDNLYPIEALSPYAHRWTIKARVTHKGEIKTWHNAAGEGRLFSFNLLDESGEIRATVFHSIGEQFDSIYEMLKENGVYFISSPCQVKMANKRFSNLPNDYELAFEKDTRVEKAEDQDAGVPQVRYNFTRVGDLQSIENNTTIDILGILKEVGEVNQIVSKTTSKPYDKRELTLVDDTLHQVRLTIWGTQATNFEAPVESVLAFKGVKVSDFGGRSLSLLSSGSMNVDPDIDDAYKLKGWYEASGRNDNFASHAGAMTGGTGGRKDEYKTINEVNQVLGLDAEATEYFTLKATVVYIRQENLYYPACPAENCNKKVIETDPGVWRCEKCDKSYKKPQYRYILSVNVQDHTGYMYLNGFDETGQVVLGKTADEMNELRDADETQAVAAVFEEANCNAYIFRCRAKLDTYQGEQKPRYQIVTTAKIDFKSESAKLTQLLKQYDLNDSLFVN